MRQDAATPGCRDPLRPYCAEIPGHTLHVIQRSRMQAPCFFGERDCAAYLHWLRLYAASCGCAVHAYVLMGNHVHLLATPSREGAATAMMRALGARYAGHLRHSHAHQGEPWEDGFRAIPVQVGRYVLSCMRYIELNPVSAGLVDLPGDYRWSSFRANALGEHDPLLTPHACYGALGRGAEARRAAYRALFRGRQGPAPN